MLSGMTKFLPCAALGAFFLCAGFSDLAAQNGRESGIPPLLAGVFQAIEYTQKSEDASGSTLNGDFSWEKTETAEYNYRLKFTNYHYYILPNSDSDEEAGTASNGKIAATINGTLIIVDSLLTGNLSVKGLSFSSFAFNDLDIDEMSGTGGVTADGVFYSQEEITRIVDNAPFAFDTNYVVNWEKECIFAGLLTFFLPVEILEWNDTMLLEAILDEEDRPPEGYTVSNDDGTLSALVRGSGVEYTYKGFIVEGPDFPLSFKATGRLRVGVDGTRDIETLSFDGKMTVEGLECFSSTQISGCVLRIEDLEEGGDIPGTIIVDGKSYSASGFFQHALRQFFYMTINP
jgi:hypothetical protein